MSRKYSITDIADDLGVSCSTVSRALSNSPGVSSSMRKRIIEYSEEIGYKPNSKSHTKGDSKNPIVALLIGDIQNPFYSNLAYSIQKVLDKFHYNLILFNTEFSVNKEMEFLQLSKNLHFAGVILMTTQSENINKQLESLNLPTVLVNRNLNSYTGDMVLLDNYEAGYEATMHLIKLNHQRIGFIKGHSSSSASRQRYDGYCKAMNNYGLRIFDEDVYYSDMRLESGEKIASEFVNKWRKNISRPTGIVISNDTTALGFISVCSSNDIQIPKDLSIVSFDNLIYDRWNSIQLTSIDQNVEEMGRRTAEILLRRIEDPQKASERIILSPSLVIRDSTAACINN